MLVNSIQNAEFSLRHDGINWNDSDRPPTPPAGSNTQFHAEKCMGITYGLTKKHEIKWLWNDIIIIVVMTSFIPGFIMGTCVHV